MAVVNSLVRHDDKSENEVKSEKVSDNKKVFFFYSLPSSA